MFKRTIYYLPILLVAVSAFSQDKWDLRRCVEYARANNISVQQTDLQSRFSELTYKQGKSSQWPTLNFSNGYSFRFGRAENPSTGILENNNIFNINFGLNAQVGLFNWFSKKNTIEASRLSYEADAAQIKKIQDDISINVAVAYLQILLAREQVNIAKVQIQTTTEQLTTTRKKVDAGVLPELNAAELEAQLSRDSSNLITATTSVEQFLLQMKALLNLDASFPFDVPSPDVGTVPVENLADLQPENVYALALVNLPQQKVIDYRLQSAKKSVDAARGQLYPTIGAFGSLSTNFVDYKSKPLLYEQILSGYQNSSLRVETAPNVYTPVQTPVYKDGSKVLLYRAPDAFIDQVDKNFGQAVGIGLSVPIFNGSVARTNYERSKLIVKQWELSKVQDNQTLKQNIYRAYNDALSAMQKQNTDKKSVETAKKSFDFAQKRYDQNLLSTFDLLNSQNNWMRARIQALYSQYDYIFKMKLLEFYKGQGIKL
jgi:outer membrane protein